MVVPFTKLHGLGNDFVLLDERESPFGLTAAQFARIADRHFGVGCDQILLLGPPTVAGTHGSYRIVNADGTSAEHCGNGVRCVARYLCDKGEVEGDSLALEIGRVAYELSLRAGGGIRVDMGRPIFEPADIPIAAETEQERYTVDFDGESLTFGCVSIGNPHAVMIVDDVTVADVARIGAGMQAHAFFPSKVNVGFLQIVDKSNVKLRVFERGVGETLACGTGACAAMAVGRHWQKLGAEVDVQLPGGTLRIEWSGRRHESLTMTGPAERVFEGIMEV